MWLWLGAIAALALQSAPAAQEGSSAEPPARISVTPEIVQTYCDGRGEINVLQLRVKLRFRNDGDSPAVLYLGSPAVVRIVLARDEGALLDGVYRTDLFPSVYSAAAAPVSSRFYALPPGRTTSADLPLAVAIPFALHSADVPGIARAGSHVLRLTVNLWPDDPALTDTWSRQLAGKGRLVHSLLVTKPIPLEIARRPRLVRCE